MAAPMLVGDAAAARARIQPALVMLGDASSDLSFAMSLMKGAELLALRGGSFDPLLPFHEIGQLGDEYLAEMDAGAKLRHAGEAAQEACASVDRCCGHLHAVLLLLGHTGLPDVDGVIEEERVAAVGELKAAKGRLKLGAGMVAGARQDVSGAN
ncbi:hypothetical protein E2562_036851 [Oryza meyeriana var. granulata]|uniref:Uncharacterized protein n=1 Tax=Oryza meyeriana var. granulata TaxID=110450 RepID=A0A6G1E7L1_9ORYZ|nr:hypothetical protein E2562_036851 [Oryza meyeriana var. granulata]